MRYLYGGENQITKDIYFSVFKDDPKKLSDYYYDKKVCDNKIAVEEVENGIAGMIQLCPKKIVVNGQKIPVNYIYAVATHVKYRSMGIMNRLLKKVIIDMAESSMPFTYLIPVNENLYKRAGFATVIERAYEFVTEGGYKFRQNIKTKRAESGDASDIAVFSERVLEREYKLFIAHDREYIDDIITQIKLDDGLIDVFYDSMNGEDNIVGYVMRYSDGAVREMLFDREQYREAVVSTDIKCKKPFIMVRILDIESFVSILKSKDAGVYTVQISDNYIKKNNGVFDINVTLDKCTICKQKYKTNLNPAHILSIEEFTLHAFGYKIIKGLPVFFDRGQIFINDEM